MSVPETITCLIHFEGISCYLTSCIFIFRGNIYINSSAYLIGCFPAISPFQIFGHLPLQLLPAFKLRYISLLYAIHEGFSFAQPMFNQFHLRRMRLLTNTRSLLMIWFFQLFTTIYSGTGWYYLNICSGVNTGSTAYSIIFFKST